MRRAQGYATFNGPNGLVECDTFTCSHCNSVTHVMPKCDPADLGGFCKVCMKLICKRCVGKACVPFEKQLLIAEQKFLARRSYV